MRKMFGTKEINEIIIQQTAVKKEFGNLRFYLSTDKKSLPSKKDRVFIL